MCTECFEIFNRKDQKHSCKDHEVSVVKRATGTYTEEEKKEFLKFQKSRAQHVKPFIQEIKNRYVPGNPEREENHMRGTTLHFVQKEKSLFNG